MGSPQWFWIMIISVSGMWAVVSVIRTIVDGVVRVRQGRMDIEREYLSQMMADIDEIKRRVEGLRKEESHV